MLLLFAPQKKYFIVIVIVIVIVLSNNRILTFLKKFRMQNPPLDELAMKTDKE